VALLSYGELAVTEGVPEFDSSVSGAGNDLSVIGGEGNGEDVVSVADEASGGGASGELPEAKSFVPGC
jgi:hypothetical protein